MIGSNHACCYFIGNSMTESKLLMILKQVIILLPCMMIYYLFFYNTGRVSILVATDVASRGLDIKDIR